MIIKSVSIVLCFRYKLNDPITTTLLLSKPVYALHGRYR